MENKILSLKSDFIITERLAQRKGASWAASFSYGEKDYYLGGSPVWQLFRVAYGCNKATA